MYLIIQYYNDRNLERQKEYDFCLENNLDNPAIKEIHNIIEKETIVPDKFKNNPKLKNIAFDYSKNINIPGRLTFKYVFEYARENIPKNEVICISNLDIFLDNSQDWINIRDEFFNKNTKKKVLCLSRINYINKYKYEIPKWWYKLYDNTFPGASSDTWVFLNPIDLNDCKFCVGNSPMMDGALHYRFVIHGYDVYNWCEKYKIYHYDICRNHGDIMIYNKTTCDEGWKAYNRGAIEIPPEQNWELILDNKEKIIYRHRSNLIKLHPLLSNENYINAFIMKVANISKKLESESNLLMGYKEINLI